MITDLLENNLVIFFTIILAAIILRKIFTKVILKILLSITNKTKTNLDTQIVKAMENPLKSFFIIFGLFVALNSLELDPEYNLLTLQIFRSSIIILLTWGLFNVSDILSTVLLKTINKCEVEIEGIFIPLVSKGVKVVLIALSVSIIAGEWGFDVNGFIAGLGIGGLAFALAAQDTLSNVFGGFVLTIDKPFAIGDWICTPNLEGTVEEISFRSTKVRTFAHAIVHVPNSTLVNQPITNWSRMGKRRITFNLGVEYGTTINQIKNSIEQLKGMLEQHPGIHKETIFVNFDKFNESSLDIFIYCFTNTTVWGEFLEVKQDVNLKILEILNENGVSVAFPSRAIYMKEEETN
ncbi:mechanosensitive ion channel family protein [Serpentinicella sp. ANB-PHB4]|uniref:mechanosensitive ion channel family protein n=1 Tax=Serpentinicella sp. ANB-PHB4 TaxID=3074076 RepID=UPI0028636155|nr:mechanosensitive ion channel family protein [Serpentinicella sp. ANB-PHB4]MDR5659040.1 mechanosensitive ion channel family protein [Serpentinicella sp. ANB-PHB4]